jgi:hypothetical protein
MHDMETANRYTRYFIHLRRAWYGDVTLRNMPYADEVLFGIGPRTGEGTCGEMAVRWYELHGILCPRLEAFDDSWRVLASFGDLLETMGSIPAGWRNAIAPRAFCALLEARGFLDRTPVHQRLLPANEPGRGPSLPER